MRLLQCTLTSTATPILPLGTPNKYASVLAIQNNAAANIRIGDNTVSATRGILLAPSAAGAPGGSITTFIDMARGTLLNSYYIFGTAGQIIDILYESSE